MFFGIKTIEVFKNILNDVESCFVNHKWGLWKILLIDSDIKIGFVGLWYFFNEPQPQLIYALSSEYRGKGFATEASKLIIDYTFNCLNFSTLLATMDKDNQLSRMVCERLSFEFLKEERRACAAMPAP